MTIKTNGTQKESTILEIGKKEPVLLHYDIEYDTTDPEEAIRDFSGKITAMLNRYEGNRTRLAEIESELNDLEHYMEIGNYKNVPEGYRMYRKLAELRRERRACKNENDLLWPIVEHFHGTEVLNRLSKVQGDCAKLKQTIDSRYYSVRTDILDEWLKPETKREDSEPGGISTETYFGMDLEPKPEIDLGHGISPIMKATMTKKYHRVWDASEQAMG